MYATFAIGYTTPQSVTLTTAFNPELPLPTYPTTGYAPSAASARINSPKSNNYNPEVAVLSSEK